MATSYNKIVTTPNPVVYFTYRIIEPWKDKSSNIAPKVIYWMAVTASILATIIDIIASLFLALITLPLQDKSQEDKSISTAFQWRAKYYAIFKQSFMADVTLSLKLFKSKSV